jgi:hypothetical protein
LTGGGERGQLRKACEGGLFLSSIRARRVRRPFEAGAACGACLMLGIALQIVFGPSAASGQQKGADRRVQGPLTVCEILSHASEYDGQMVQVRARLNSTGEGSWLIGEGCDGVFVAAGKVWPSWIAVGIPPVRDRPESHSSLHTVNFYFDWESYERFQRKAALLRQGAAAECLEGIYAGMFETRTDWASATQTYSDGSTRVFGLGPQGAAPGQLIPKSYDDIRQIPGCVAKSPGAQQSK